VCFEYSFRIHPWTLRRILLLIAKLIPTTAGSRFAITYNFLLTPYSTLILENRIVSQLVKKFPTLYRNRRFITVFTKSRHWTLSLINRIRSTPSHRIYLRYILISSFHLYLLLPSGLFPTGVRMKILYAFFTSSIRVTSPTHFILLKLIALIILGDK
jgi:hypothetical protein